MPQQMAWGGSVCNYCCKICRSLTLHKERFFFPLEIESCRYFKCRFGLFRGTRWRKCVIYMLVQKQPVFPLDIINIML